MGSRNYRCPVQQGLSEGGQSEWLIKAGGSYIDLVGVKFDIGLLIGKSLA